jgi:hypothetical protein
MPILRLLAIALVALASAAAVVSATAQTTSAPGKPASPGAALDTMPAIAFYLARGEADACGRGCSAWIAADGKIDAGAAQRLRRLLEKLGRARPPIYFHSPGGSLSGGLELGRLIRAQKLEVSVAHTIPLSCDRDKPAEKACEAQKRSGQDLQAEFDPTVAMCNSSCVYAVAGGTVRLIPLWVKLGIHDVGFDPAKTPAHARLGEARSVAHERIQEYLHEMGFDDALFRAAAAVPFESHRLLERDDLVRFGIDRRELGETVWRFVDKPLKAVSKGFFARSDSDPHRYLEGLVRLDCGAGHTIRLGLARGRAGLEAPAGQHPPGISLNGNRVDLRDQIPSAEFDIHSARLSASAFEAAGDDTTIELSAADLDRNPTSGGMALDMAGFSAAFAKLRKSCDDSVPNLVATTLPANAPFPYLDPKSLGTLSAPASWPGPKNPPAAPFAVAPAAIQPIPRAAAANAAPPPPPSPPVQPVCGLRISDVPQHTMGRVTGFLSGDEALTRTRRVEAELGARINPDYFALKRAIVERYPDGNGSTMAAIPEDMDVKIGDLVELASRYRDQALPCHFVPWTIDRLVDHAQAE